MGLLLPRHSREGPLSEVFLLKILMSVTGKPPWLEDEKPYPIEAAEAFAMTVETTAYALLQALSRNDIDYATPIARWPTMQQNYGGGFHSTQFPLGRKIHIKLTGQGTGTLTVLMGTGKMTSWKILQVIFGPAWNLPILWP
ncbi:complement C5-like isoform X2 [Stegostoma tigrinum]|uniref:complement C5-like isoform X2 n=1 Tax=Stegostoma tigrinum TaxID=3053191 RepID=UPI0028704839|nr:complement C5-like isoform X2 [Stegostoma tigrinum]